MGSETLEEFRRLDNFKLALENPKNQNYGNSRKLREQMTTINHPDKFQIAENLREIGALIKMKGENSFRAKAYENAASALEGISEELPELVENERLTEIRGIGNSIAGLIKEIYLTGQAKSLEKLKAEFPPGILELGAIPGLSVKKVEALHAALGISSLDELKKAIDSSLIRTVKGFSEKSEKNIAEAIVSYETRSHQILLIDALDTANLLIEHFERSKDVASVSIAGAVSRWQEAVDSIDVVVSAHNFSKVLDHFEKFPYLIRMEERSADRARAKLSESLVMVNIYLCQPTEFICTLHYYTGTSDYNAGLEAVAKSAGLALTRSEITSSAKSVQINSQEDIYKHLGLPYIPVELREDVQVITDAVSGTTYDDLIEIDDIRGMTHCHSTFSDGVASIEEMARAVKKMKREYITMTDHSPAAHYANGILPERLLEQWREIEQAQKSVGIAVLKGTESDILADGSLDYPDDILGQLDVIIASIHSRMKMDENQMTTRLVNCMRQKRFKIWGHALGRLVLRREPVACRMLEVLDVAAASRVAIEVNGDPHRLDMEPKWLREARKRKMRFVISTDAHSINNLQYLKFGIHLARRAAVRKSEVLNTLSVEEFRRAVKP